MKKNRRKIIIISLSLLIIGFTAMIICSPFGCHKDFNYKLVVHSMEINAPADSIYSFLGKSSNASKWSVFVNHIIPLNSNEVPDGRVGCKRRCFKFADEKGLQWDEEIRVADLNKRRRLTIYNMVDFDMKAEGLATEQIYDAISPNITKLSFTLFYINNNPSLLDLFKTYFSAYEIKSIYEKNITNIKNIIETGHK